MIAITISGLNAVMDMALASNELTTISFDTISLSIAMSTVSMASSAIYFRVRSFDADQIWYVLLPLGNVLFSARSYLVPFESRFWVTCQLTWFIAGTLQVLWALSNLVRQLKRSPGTPDEVATSTPDDNK